MKKKKHVGGYQKQSSRQRLFFLGKIFLNLLFIALLFLIQLYKTFTMFLRGDQFLLLFVVDALFQGRNEVR